MNEADQARTARNRKLVRGCLMAFVGVWALILLVVAIGAIIVWRWSRTPEGQDVVSRLSEGVDVMRDSMSGPGPEAMQRLGCDQAMVIPASRVMQAVDPSKPISAEQDATILMCQVGMLGHAPGCPEIAAVWLDVNEGLAPAPFIVGVQRSGTAGRLCEESYLPDGTLAPKQGAAQGR